MNICGRSTFHHHGNDAQKWMTHRNPMQQLDVRKVSKLFNRQAGRGLCNLQMLKHDEWIDIIFAAGSSEIKLWMTYDLDSVDWFMIQIDWCFSWCFCWSHVKPAKVFAGHHHGRGCRPFAQSPWVSWPLNRRIKIICRTKLWTIHILDNFEGWSNHPYFEAW